MTGKIASYMNIDFKRLSEIFKKQVYIPYPIKLLSILKDSADLTCESSIITYWKTFSQRIYWINISDLSGQYLKEIFIKNYQQIINLEIIKEPIRIGFYHNDLKQTTKKEMLFYIKKVAQDIKGIFNKFNLSNFETVNDNKFIFTIRSD
jgi:hypothetical protein